MADFQPGGVDQFQNFVTPTDFSFLQYGLAQKQAQYEQGLNQVRSVYSSVLNAPLTNPNNQAVREQYLSDAQANIQKLTKADLSLPQNVEQAGKIFAPFWQDQDILQDYSKTKYLNNQLQTAQSDKESKDKNIRDSWNGDSVDRIGWALKDLREANRGDGSISKVQAPEYFPYENPLDAVNAFSKATGFTGIEKTYHNGAYLITTKNGVDAVPDLQTYVNGILGDKFNKQFQTRGYNIMRSEMQNIQNMHPSYDKNQIMQELVKSKYNTYITTTYDTPKNHLNDFIQLNNNAIKEINNKKVKTAEDEANIRKFNNNIEKSNIALEDLENKRYKDLYNNQGNLKSPDEIFSNFMSNPEHYYGIIERNDHIHQLAETLAAQSSYKEDIDPVWKFSKEEDDRKWRQKFDTVKLQHEDYNKAEDRKIEREKLAEKYLADQIDPKTGLSITANPLVSPNIHDEGRATTSVEDRGNASSLIEQDKGNALTSMSKTLFSTGAMNKMLNRLGITDETVQANFNGYMSRRYSPEGYVSGDLKWTKQEQDAYNSVVSTLKQKKYITGNSGNEVLDGLGKFLLQEIKNGKQLKAPAHPDSDLAQITDLWSSAMEDKQKFDRINKEQTDWIKHLISTPEGKKKYQKLVKQNGDGFITGFDVAQLIPDMKLIDENGQARIFSNQEIGNAYVNNNLSVNNGEVTINGKKYLFDGLGSAIAGQTHLGKIFDKYGFPEDRQKLNEELSKEVSDKLSYYKDETGAIGRKVSFPIGKAEKPGSNELLIQEAINPANYNSIHYTEPDGTKGVLTKQENFNALNKYLNSVSTIVGNKIQAKFNNVSGLHTPTVDIQLPEDKELGKISGHKITIELAANAHGDILDKIVRNKTYETWDKLNRGETITSNPWDAEYGFDFKLAPVNNNDKSIYSFKWHYTKVNPDGTEKLEEVNEPLIDVRSISPNRIQEIISEKRRASINYMLSKRAEYNKNNPAK